MTLETDESANRYEISYHQAWRCVDNFFQKTAKSHQVSVCSVKQFILIFKRSKTLQQQTFCAIFFCIRRTLNSKIKTCLKIDYRRVSHFTPLAWFLWNNSDSFYISSLTHNTARRRMLLWFCASSNSFIKFQMPKRDCVVVRWKYLCVGNICPLKDKMCIMDVFLEILHINREMCEVIHIKLMKKYSSLMIKIDCSTDIVPILSLWHD